MNTRTALVAPALLAVAALSLTGCSAYENLVHKQATSTFDDVDAFRDGAGTDADWLPADATGIVVRTSTIENTPDAVVLLTSDSELSTQCAEVERRSAPTWALEEAPDPYDAKTVFACGEWSVIDTGTGWYGWTPNSEDERAEASAG